MRRFALQAGVEAGVPLADAALVPRLNALLARDDWSELDLDTLSLGLVIARQEDSGPWLEACASTTPTFAVELAFEISRYSLRFARVGGVIARVVERVAEPPAGALPTPEFWRELRRVADATPSVREALRAIVDARPSTHSLRVRAGLAFLFPELWTAEDEAAALRVVDPAAGGLMLLALLRRERAAVDCLVWPPPPALLLSLSDAAFAAARRWCSGEQRRQVFGIRVALRKIEDDLPDALADLSQRDTLRALRAVRPTQRLLERLRALPRSPRPATTFLRTLLVSRWERLTDDHVLDAEQLRRLRRAFRLRDHAAVTALARRMSADELSCFSAQLFFDWLIDGCPEAAQWPLEALALFPTSEAIDALAQLAQAWCDDGWLPLALIDTIADAGGTSSIARLHELSNARLPDRVKELARAHFEASARHDGLTTMEQEDRLFPPLALRPRERVTLSGDGTPALERNGAPVGLKGTWKAAAKQVPAALRRLERLMCELPPMNAIHFTETWGMNPLLSAIADRFVWATFRDGVRGALFVPGRGPAPELDDRTGVRPVHRVELSSEELAVARTWVAAQPFPQLERPVVTSIPRVRDGSYEVPRRARNLLLAAGWQSGGSDDHSPAFTRGGEGWQATLVLVGEMTTFGSFQLEARLELEGDVEPRIASEVRREVSLAIACDD